MNIVVHKRVEDFLDMGYGMFVHFGAYSQYNRGEWCLNLSNMDGKKYAKDAIGLDFSNFDMEKLVLTAKNAGMKYITFTTRHHDGFSLYDAKDLSDYNIMNTPNGRDLMREFVDCCNKHGIKPHFYHTTLDWYQKDFKEDFNKYLDYLYKSVEILCTQYGDIGALWFDGNWSNLDADWKLDRLYGMIRKNQPNAMIINNTGLEQRGEISHPEIDSVTFEQDKSSPINYEKIGKKIAGEVCLTLNHHWGVAEDFDYKTPRDVLNILCSSRKNEANLLLNVSPYLDGSIPTIQQGILEEVKNWLNLNGEAIYSVRPTKFTGNDENFIVKKEDNYYAFVMKIGKRGDVNVSTDISTFDAVYDGIDKEIKDMVWLDNGEKVNFTQDLGKKQVYVPNVAFEYGVNRIVRVAKFNF